MPITTHLKIRNVANKIKKQTIIKKIETLNKEYKSLFQLKPKIAVLGLNPHNNEYSKKSEEIREIIPAVKILKKRY